MNAAKNILARVVPLENLPEFMKAQFLLGRAGQLASNWTNLSDLVKVELATLRSHRKRGFRFLQSDGEIRICAA